jgi:hypothetical protein
MVSRVSNRKVTTNPDFSFSTFYVELPFLSLKLNCAVHMTTTSPSRKSSNIGFIFVAALASCYAAFYNGFPLVYSDTGTYLRSGFEGELAVDRPIFYGLFLRHVSLAETLWLVVFVQAVITCWLLHLITGILFSGIKRNIIFLASVLLVTLATGYSYNVSILIPDIFATNSFLAFLVLLFSKELSKLKWVIISIVLLFSLSTHYSNIPIFILLFVIILPAIWLKRRKGVQHVSLKRILFTLGLFVFTIIMIPSVNYSYNGKFRYSESSHVFLFNHMIEIGAAQEYLEDNCDKNNFAICEYKEELKWDFLWNYSGPLYKTGGWKENEKDFNEINYGIISSPKYWPLLAHKTVEYTAKQLFLFDTGLQKVKKHEAPQPQIEKYFKNSIREYVSTKQLNEKVDFRLLNSIEGVLIFLCSFFLVIVLILNRSLPLFSERFTFFLQLIIMYSVINAMVCSNLSTAIDRYHNRWAWMLVIVAIYAAILIYEKRKDVFSSNTSSLS